MGEAEEVPPKDGNDDGDGKEDEEGRGGGGNDSKRKQAAASIKVSPRSFNLGFRHPVTGQFPK